MKTFGEHEQLIDHLVHSIHDKISLQTALMKLFLRLFLSWFLSDSVLKNCRHIFLEHQQTISKVHSETTDVSAPWFLTHTMFNLNSEFLAGMSDKFCLNCSLCSRLTVMLFSTVGEVRVPVFQVVVLFFSTTE